MRRGVMTGILICLVMAVAVRPAYAAEDRGTIRVVLGPELAGKTVTLYSAMDTGAGTLELAGEYGEGWSKKLSEDGVAMFTGLPEGMYLLAVENILAVPVKLPEADGSWMAEVSPGMIYITPETGQPVAPVLWAMGMIVSAFGIGIWYESWHKRKKD